MPGISDFIRRLVALQFTTASGFKDFPKFRPFFTQSQIFLHTYRKPPPPKILEEPAPLISSASGFKNFPKHFDHFVLSRKYFCTLIENPHPPKILEETADEDLGNVAVS